MIQELEQTNVDVSNINVEDKKPDLTHFIQCANLCVIPDKGLNVICFHGVDGKAFLGVLLVETFDSFLVGAPIRLILNEHRNIVVETMSSEPIIRVMKSSISFLTTASIKTLYHYYLFLVSNGKFLLPDLITEDIFNIIKDYIHSYESDFSNADTHIQPMKSTPNNSFNSSILSKRIH